MKGIITEIERFALKDGPGIRTTVFFKGCNMACKWCHNPETLSVRPQLMIYPDKCIGCGACVAACPNGAAHLFTGAKLVHLSLMPLGKEERGRRARNMVDDLEANFGHCSLYGECADVCPAGVPLTAVSAVTRERARAAFRGKDD